MHPNAGGFQITRKNVKETQNKLNELFKNINIEDVYMVDYEIPVGRLKEKQVLQVGQWEDVWGNTLKEPLFAITDIVVDASSIQLIGEKRNLIKFEKQSGSNKIVFIKAFAGEKIYNEMTMKNHVGLSKKNNNKIKLDIIGKFTVNKWNGNEFPQIEILDFNCSETKEFRF